VDEVCRLDDAAAADADGDGVHGRQAYALANVRRSSYVPSVIDRFLNLPQPDYEADDILVVSETEQLRALGDDARHRIVGLLRERAMSTTELAERVGLAKGTVAHHVKVLEAAGLIQVVRTRRVRALTESFYGRVARLFVIKSTDEKPHVRVRLSATDAAAFQQRIAELARDVEAAAATRGEEYELVASLYPSGGLT
jgi:DNA-binding transcriptional ArsR family regulator